MTPEEIKKAVEADGSKLEDVTGGCALSSSDFLCLIVALESLILEADRRMQAAAAEGDLPLFFSAAIRQSEAIELRGRLVKVTGVHNERAEAKAREEACQQSNIDPRWTGVPPQGNA